MKKIIINIVEILLLFAMTDICYAQITFPDLILNNQTFSTGNYNYNNNTNIISPDDPSKPVTVTNNANVVFKAGNSISLKPGFSVNSLSTGSFRAYIGSNSFDVVIIEPLYSSGHVNKYEKLEVGLKLPQDITDNINKYIYHNNPGGLNPFDPDQISIEADFTSPTGKVKTIYGFYYKEFIRNVPNNIWDTLHTDYPWRIRFAPDEIGNWSMIVNVSINYGNSSVLTSNGCDFICDNSYNQGYLEVGNYGRFLRYSGTKNTFFAIGEDIASADKTDNMVVPASYSEYESQMMELSNVNGNYMRHFMASYVHCIEWGSSVTNYNFSYDTSPTGEPQVWGGGVPNGAQNNGQINAWELDQIFNLAKSNRIYIHLTIDNAQDFDNSSNGYWSSNPYHNEVGTPLDFFMNSNSSLINNVWHCYKKKLRYIVARWGYSTNLACYELFNEIDNMNNYYTIYPPPYPPIDNPSFQQYIGPFQREMAYYLKSNDPNHLVTTSYAAPFPGAFDGSYTSNYIDFTSLHYYDNGSSIINSDDRSSALFKLWNTFSKPNIIGEFGTGGTPSGLQQELCSDVSFHNTLWASAFMGSFGAGLDWYGYKLHDPCCEFYKNIGTLASSFINGINFEEASYFPVIHYGDWHWNLFHGWQFKLNQLESFSLIKEGGDRAIGWVHQLSYYWHNLANIYPCLSDFGAISIGASTVPSSENLIVTNLNYDKPRKFNIYIYNVPHDGTIITQYGSVEQGSVDLEGECKLKIGSLFNLAPDYAYQMVKCQNSSRENEENEMIYDTLSCPVDTVYFSGTYGRDTTGVYSYYWNFGNGKTSNEWHPKVYYNHPGNYLITLVINGNNGNIDTLKQLTTVLNCDSLFPDTNSIYGILTKNPSCGGAPIINDTLQLVNVTNNIVPNVTAAINDSAGKFNFIMAQLMSLDTTALFGFKAKSGNILNDTSHKTILQWILQSPLSLFYTTPCKDSTGNSKISNLNVKANVSDTFFVHIVPNPNNGNMKVLYKIPKDVIGALEIYNSLGIKLFSYPLLSGKNTFSISETEIDAGIYFYRAIAGNKLIAKDKIVVIK